MKKVLNLYKPAGATPLEAIKKFKLQNPVYKDLKMTYAGRLDPMAEGVLLVLTGSELKNQKKYWGLDKEYEAEILFGFSTDTYDILGIPTTGATLNEVLLRQTLDRFQGKYTFPLPPYSSQKIEGKPLFWWARAGKLDEIDIPQKTVTIKKVKLLGTKEIKKEVLLTRVLAKISLVQGDFRQEEIKKAWKEAFSGVEETDFYVAKIKIKCSSGTYIRAIAQDLGQVLECGAVLLSLTRTCVGKYTTKKSLPLN